MSEVEAILDSQLDERLKSAQCLKAELECRLLERQLSKPSQKLEIFKAIAGGSGLLLAFVAVVGGLLSVLAWFFDRSRERDIRAQERLDRILVGLTAPTVEQRITNIAALQDSILKGESARNVQIVTSLVGQLSLDKSSIARRMTLSVFWSFDKHVIGHDPLNAGLAALARNSRVLMKESGLSNGLGKQDTFHLTGEHGATLIDIAEAMAIFIRRGAKVSDLSGIYMANQDLSERSLEGVSFDEAILGYTRFNYAKLRGSSFAGAHLEGVTFVGADLRSAKFTGAPRRGRAMEPYINRVSVLRGMGAGIHSTVEMPDFSCSDLREADFSRHALLLFIDDVAAKTMDYYHWPVRFQGANLAKVNLRDLSMYAITHPAGSIHPFAGGGGGDSLLIEKNVFLDRYVADDKAKLGNSMKSFPITAKGFVESFRGTNWRDATLPVWLREFLDKENVSQLYEFEDGIPCRPVAPW